MGSYISNLFPSHSSQSSTFTTKTQATMLLRPATLSDVPGLTNLGAKTFEDTALDKFLSPNRRAHPRCHLRGISQRITLRILDPKNETWVVSRADDPEALTAYMQFVRLGDEGRAAVGSGIGGLWRWGLGRVLKAWFKVRNYFAPDRSVDLRNLKKFEKWVEVDDEKYWGRYPDRWHVQSMVVAKEWQGKGIGKRLMEEVIKRGEKDGVVVGLEASVEGERLYRRVGFVKLGDFTGDKLDDKGDGGVFCRWPGGKVPGDVEVMP